MNYSVNLNRRLGGGPYTEDYDIIGSIVKIMVPFWIPIIIRYSKRDQ